MQRTLTSLFKLAAAAVLMFGLAAQAEDTKVDPTGTWTWSFTGQNGQTRTTTMKLKLDGEKLTGTISGRNNDTPIEDAKLKGDEISFKVTREFNGNKFVAKYSGKVSGETIKGKIETERDGETRSRDWEAKKGEPKTDKDK